jgi:hypothetical protein
MTISLAVWSWREAIEKLQKSLQFGLPNTVNTSFATMLLDKFLSLSTMEVVGLPYFLSAIQRCSSQLEHELIFTGSRLSACERHCYLTSGELKPSLSSADCRRTAPNLVSSKLREVITSTKYPLQRPKLPTYARWWCGISITKHK